MVNDGFENSQDQSSIIDRRFRFLPFAHYLSAELSRVITGSGTDFGRCSDLCSRLAAKRARAKSLEEATRRGKERREAKRREASVPPDSCTSTGGFVSDSSVSIGGGGADRYPYPAWAGLELHPHPRRLPGAVTTAASRTAHCRVSPCSRWGRWPPSCFILSCFHWIAFLNSISR